MKIILAVSSFFFFSVNVLAQDKIRHECFPIKEYSDLSKVQIVYSPGEPYGKEFLELYGIWGVLIDRWEVQYADDMTYIAYFNEAESVYFDRDWPVEKDSGAGRLQLGSGKGASHRQKTYWLDCFSPIFPRN